MNTEIRYYRCPNCQRAPHLRLSEEMRDSEVCFECEFCLYKINIDKNTPQTQPDSNVIYRE